MDNIARRTEGSIISAPRIGYRHVGLLLGYWNGPEPMVIDNSPEAGGVSIRTLTDFCAGRDVRIDHEPTLGDGAAVVARAFRKQGVPYSLLRFNCEHFVSWAYGLPSTSPQLRRAGLGLGLLFSAGVFASFSNE